MFSAIRGEGKGFLINLTVKLCHLSIPSCSTWSFPDLTQMKWKQCEEGNLKYSLSLTDGRLRFCEVD